jgi:2-phosphosulfolactate phosphatase
VTDLLRFDWGPTGAAAMTAEADIAVVVDVLSFTTTLTVAVERGLTVFPYVWKGSRAEEYAADRDAVLAIGRFEDRNAGGVTLSPAAMSRVEGVERIVLPSPHGSSICFALADSGLTVIGACLRNRAAVGRWLAPRLADGQRIAVVAAGERWPDGSLRPGLEDLWGAGAVTAALGQEHASPEARHAALAFEAARPLLTDELLACASGVELVTADFRDDVLMAAELDASDVVPVLAGEAFVAAG